MLRLIIGSKLGSKVSLVKNKDRGISLGKV
jgi:hypothetical protein